MRPANRTVQATYPRGCSFMHATVNQPRNRPTPHPMHNLAGSSDVLGDHLMAHTTNPCPPAWLGGGSNEEKVSQLKAMEPNGKRYY